MHLLYEQYIGMQSIISSLEIHQLFFCAGLGKVIGCKK